jgi:hypothetical protein
MRSVWTLNDLYIGKVALLNDGTLEDLKRVLNYVFPKDTKKLGGYTKYYYKNNVVSHYWRASDFTDLPTQSVKIFLQELPTKNWTLEDLRLGKCALINNADSIKLRCVIKAVCPNDKVTIGNNLFYFVKSGKFCRKNRVDLPKQSLELFFNQISQESLIWSLNDWKAGKCSISNDGTLEDLNKVINYIFPHIQINTNGFKCWNCYNNTPQGSNHTNLPQQSIKKFLEQLPQKEYTIEELASGECALINDGTVQDLQKVISKAFPTSMVPDGSSSYYYLSLTDTWDSGSTTDLQKQSVGIFLKQLSQDTNTVSLTRKHFIELFHSVNTDKSENWLTNVLNPLRFSLDTYIVKMSYESIIDFWKVSSDSQKVLLNNWGIKIPLINLANYPNGFYNITILGESYDIEKISESLFKRIGKSTILNISDLHETSITEIKPLKLIEM